MALLTVIQPNPPFSLMFESPVSGWSGWSGWSTRTVIQLRRRPLLWGVESVTFRCQRHVYLCEYLPFKAGWASPIPPSPSVAQVSSHSLVSLTLGGVHDAFVLLMTRIQRLLCCTMAQGGLRYNGISTGSDYCLWRKLISRTQVQCKVIKGHLRHLAISLHGNLLAMYYLSHTLLHACIVILIFWYFIFPQTESGTVW